jgi:hypothetical protein
MKKAVLASISVMAFCVGQAKAGGQLSLYAGYPDPGQLNLSSVQTGLDLRGTAPYGVRAEGDFLKIFGIEENFGFSPRLFNSALFPNQGSGAEVRGFLYSTNLVVNIPFGRLVPYVTGGVGLARPWGVSFPTFLATFAGNYGGGVKMDRLAGPHGLRFDVRGWRTGNILSQGSVNFLEASGGLTLSWGKR